MHEKRKVTVSKFLSRILRHAPGDLGLRLEPGGWVLVGDLLSRTERVGFPITPDELREVVETSDKQRFAFDDTGTKIRANQGHSTEVDLQLTPTDPLPQLFHGTTTANLVSVFRDGLVRMARHHVHLSADTATARKVGSRHGKPIVLVIDAAQMQADGHEFFRSANGVWLVEHVPPQYLRVMTLEN